MIHEGEINECALFPDAVLRDVEAGHLAVGSRRSVGTTIENSRAAACGVVDGPEDRFACGGDAARNIKDRVLSSARHGEGFRAKSVAGDAHATVCGAHHSCDDRWILLNRNEKLLVGHSDRLRGSTDGADDGGRGGIHNPPRGGFPVEGELKGLRIVEPLLGGGGKERAFERIFHFDPERDDRSGGACDGCVEELGWVAFPDFGGVLECRRCSCSSIGSALAELSHEITRLIGIPCGCAGDDGGDSSLRN